MPTSPPYWTSLWTHMGDVAFLDDEKHYYDNTMTDIICSVDLWKVSLVMKSTLGFERNPQRSEWTWEWQPEHMNSRWRHRCWWWWWYDDDDDDDDDDGGCWWRRLVALQLIASVYGNNNNNNNKWLVYLQSAHLSTGCWEDSMNIHHRVCLVCSAGLLFASLWVWVSFPARDVNVSVSSQNSRTALKMLLLILWKKWRMFQAARERRK